MVRQVFTYYLVAKVSCTKSVHCSESFFKHRLSLGSEASGSNRLEMVLVKSKISEGNRGIHKKK